MLAVLAAASSSLQDTVGGPECSPCRLPYIGEPPVGKRRAAILIEGPCDFCGADGRCCSQDAAGSPGCVGGVDVRQPCGVERFCCSSTPPRPYASGDDAGPLLPRPQVDNALFTPRLSPPASRNHRTSLRTGAALATCRRHRRARRRRRRLAGARGVPQRPLARPVRQIRLRRKCRRARRSVSREASPPSVPISPTPRGWLRVDCRRRLAGRRRTSRSTRRESGSMRAPTEVQKANLGGDVAGVLGSGMSECSRACTSTHTVPACVIPRGFSGFWRCATK